MKDIKDMMELMKKGFHGKILKVEETNSHDFYKDKDGNINTQYEKRDGFAITVKLDNFDTEWSEFFSTPSPLGWHKSNMGKFVERYGTYPQIDMLVDCRPDEESGLMKIKL